ncbi:P-loop containing nucleoside triphosphate hydrolase protein [Phanerochaete sordida]|uniref:P-loop containing nucleoside triphosphate hydrolase protein n=1 Tax=Phanerochaete sordida TaxID=48140 RepID=A0A9P3G804_9APHY|nr:P-loop containing nucleoside triphosphate hydrolase protein [Phanerochaete sordida]
MDALKSLVQPLVGGSGGSMIDGVKLVVLGGTVETARRMASSGWSHFINSFFLTAHFSEEDYPYDWLMLWLSRRPEWQRSREFETTTRTSTPGFSSRTGDNSFGDDEENDDDVPGKVKTRVVFQPTPNTTHTIYYRGHWLRVRRTRKQDPYGGSSEVLSISVVARNNSILKQLVLQAKKEYEAEAVHRIQIYFADSHGCWRWTDSRHKRPMSSIVLNPGVKEMLLSDTKDFLKSEKWYADRGIPFRRGYLLHGVPGSGKSSLIHAIAGELMLDIYVVSLSSSWINDSTLTTLMGRVPARCIVLLEDLDAAFTRSTSRDEEATGSPESKTSSNSSESTDSHSRSRRHNKEHLSDVNTLSLSGLLNALDGVAASEGRILFATTNHLERLDPALSRPGRMDVWVEFRNASKWQAELLFRNFFPSSDEEEEIIEGDLEGVELPMPPSPSTSSASSTFSSLLSAISPATSSVSSWSGSSTPLTPAGSTMNSPKAPKANPLEALKNQAYLPPAVEEDDIAAFKHTSPPLDGETLSKLAKEFADSIPDEEFSVAALQGYLLKNKSSPEKAASIAAAWVVEEREMRERLKKERELKEKQAREKRRQELLEQAADKKKAEEEAAKLAAAGQTAAVITDIVVPVPAPPALPVVIDIEENKENASQDDQSDSESSSGSRTPGDEPAPWIQVDN